ncbi:transporter substrate-binding domain-containing protein [Agrobacterium tumefaciens]|uniref:transporter substrate-binding domain-containing protein n=1 Tax=Agrobacterium tumefaciens TaxID=358 RepID=UPI0011F0AC58|nr:transporter substrate-binding domain-containing protein [Agrobacterium tumefaciens]KAA1233924.1 transporter substrate-binding domain-containing protein [Agrobacterium tumefaciens]MQB37522.1 amino acid ABC transporter substrate-binding protein [Agrobacterium tumefaciens]
MTEFDIETIRNEIAPSGILVCALNHGNVVLVSRGQTDDTPTGVSVDLARALAERLSLPIRFRHYEKAGAVSGSADTGEWDICFLAIDPERAERIAYSEPYVLIEGAFLVRCVLDVSSLPDIVRLRLKIGAVKGSAYELFLSRNGGAGELIRFDSFPEARDALQAGELDGLAGVRQAMQKVAGDQPGYEVTAEPFMAIPQAVGVSVSRPLAAAFVKAFVDEKKVAGFVRTALDRSGHPDVVVP